MGRKIKAIFTSLLVALLTSCDSGTSVPAGKGFPGAEWQMKTPEEVGLDSAKLEKNLSSFSGPVIVIRDGYLIYSKGDLTKQVQTFSVSKSITALIFATLLQQGKLNYDDLVPDSDLPSAPQASFRHFLTMTSDYGLNPHNPGKHYAYNNNAIHFYGGYIATTFFRTKSPRKVLQEAIWNHIGRQDPVSFSGQWGGWDGGFAISPRDLARIGHLVLNEGNWNGIQVLSSSFVKQLYLSQIPVDATANYDKGPNNKWNQHQFSDELKGKYSFAWWILDPETDSPKAISASGYRGKQLVICPEYNLVIVGMPHQKNAPDAIEYVGAVTTALKESTK
ncbi:MAG: serine hydrolase [Moorea sp. SIO2B7]|nr:serine hydrolase [Moorena sp. SIO2B7]